MELISEPNKPQLKVIVQPASQMRFRYKSEDSNSHGSLYGPEKGSFPTVKLMNYKGDKRAITIKASLYTNEEDDEDAKLHFHLLQGASCKNGVCIKDLNSESIAVFNHIKILFCAVKDIEIKLFKQYCQEYGSKNEAELKKKAKEESKRINPYTKIKFEAYHPKKGLIAEVFSNPICDQKNVNCNTLKIEEICPESSPAEGDVKMILLCDKVNKNTIRIRFYEEDTGWEKFIEPEDTKVHRQTAIIFKVPAYDLDFQDNKKVKIQLLRNEQESEPVIFTYTQTPVVCTQILNHDTQLLPHKRRKLDPSIDSLDQECDSGVESTSSGSYQNPSPQSVSSTNQLDTGEYPEPNSPVMDLNNDLDIFSHIYQTIETIPIYDIQNENINDDDIFCVNYQNMGIQGLKLNSTNPVLSNPNVPTPPNIRWQTDSETYDGKIYGQMAKINKLNIYEDFGKNNKVDVKPEKCNKQSEQSYNDLTLQKQFNELKISEDSNKCKIKANMAKKSSLSLSFTDAFKLYVRQHFDLIHSLLQRFILHNKISILRTMFNELHQISSSFINKKDYNTGKTLLHVALQFESNGEIVQLLLENDADPSITDKNGNTPFHLAAKYQSSTCLALLFKHLNYNSPVLNYINEDGLTALHISVISKSINCCRFLIKKEVDGKIKDKNGKSILHTAIQEAPDFVEDLIPISNINDQDAEGLTALHLACTANQLNSVNLLLEKGANPLISCNLGNTAYDLAEKHKDVQEILKLHIESLKSKSSQDISSIDNETIKKLEESLNPPNNGWEMLALFSEIEDNLLNGIKTLYKDNPTNKILHILKKKHKTIDELLEILQFAELKEAHDILKNSIKSTS